MDAYYESTHIENLTINGNNYVIDGAGASFYFDFTSEKEWDVEKI